MLMIRFQRIGRTNDPSFRIVLLEHARAARTGKIVEQLGNYNPRTKAFSIDEARVQEWIGKGAQPTDTVRNLLITKGVLTGSKVDVFPASGRKKMAEAAAKAVKEAEDAAAAAKAAAEAPVAAPEEVAVEEAATDIPEETPASAEASSGEPVVESKDGAGPSVS